MTIQFYVTEETRLHRCNQIAESTDILAELAADLPGAGLAGDPRRAQLIYLAGITRVFNRIVSVLVKGESSSGKSHLLNTALKFFPEDSYDIISGMSEKALIYSGEKRDLRHKHLVIGEFAGLQSPTGNKWLRQLMSENQLDYDVATPTSTGYETQRISVKGPTGVLMTTTETGLHIEDMTRMLAFELVDGPDQIKSTLEAMSYAFVTCAPYHEPDYVPWHMFAKQVTSGEVEVIVPFIRKLVELLPPSAARLRRDFGQISWLICAHALLHRRNRASDDAGRIIATVQDYAVVHGLVADIVEEGLEATVPCEVRETVEAVGRLQESTRLAVTNKQLAEELNLSPAAVSRRVRTAEEMGYLTNHEPNPGRPSRIVSCEPLPEDRTVLPTPAELEAAWAKVPA